jgi:hypothetical protein
VCRAGQRPGQGRPLRDVGAHPLQLPGGDACADAARTGVGSGFLTAQVRVCVVTCTMTCRRRSAMAQRQGQLVLE